ncbi:hypothetical protein KY289_012252 [Solanum tuberosum]|nr:hypothetical protein KY289_012252 [Solanum tuberosum]
MGIIFSDHTNHAFTPLASTQLIWLTIQVIGFLLLNMHLHVCWLHFIINSRTILEQSVFVQVNLHVGFCIFFKTEVVVQESNPCIHGARSFGYSPDESILQKFWKLCEHQLNIPGGLCSLIRCFLFIGGSSSSHLIVV